MRDMIAELKAMHPHDGLQVTIDAMLDALQSTGSYVKHGKKLLCIDGNKISAF